MKSWMLQCWGPWHRGRFVPEVLLVEQRLSVVQPARPTRAACAVFAPATPNFTSEWKCIFFWCFKKIIIKEQKAYLCTKSIADTPCHAVGLPSRPALLTQRD